MRPVIDPGTINTNKRFRRITINHVDSGIIRMATGYFGRAMPRPVKHLSVRQGRIGPDKMACNQPRGTRHPDPVQIKIHVRDASRQILTERTFRDAFRGTPNEHIFAVHRVFALINTQFQIVFHRRFFLQFHIVTPVLRRLGHLHRVNTIAHFEIIERLGQRHAGRPRPRALHFRREILFPDGVEFYICREVAETLGQAATQHRNARNQFQFRRQEQLGRLGLVFNHSPELERETRLYTKAQHTIQGEIRRGDCLAKGIDGSGSAAQTGRYFCLRHGDRPMTEIKAADRRVGGDKTPHVVFVAH